MKSTPIESHRGTLAPSKITMVKKELTSGEPCKKCAQALATLEERGLLGRIDEVVIAKEGDPESPGMKLGERFRIDLAPFFVIERPGREPEVFTSVIKFIKALGELAPGSGEAARPASEDAASRDSGSRDSGSSPEELRQRLSGQSPQKILEAALRLHGEGCGISFSGAEDVVLIDMASKLGLPFSVFTLDTGRLHPETLRFIDKVRERYGIEISVVSPDPRELEPFVKQHGLFSFYRDGHEQCCAIRKVAPLKRALATLEAWVTGQRKDQSVTRVDLDVVSVDAAHAGRSGRLLKWNPLAEWSSARVWEYIRDNELPYNELHDRGFVSIGCEPCTRAVRPGEHERAGRWWWELETQRECGLHRAK